jgi:hypothetical protein
MVLQSLWTSAAFYFLNLDSQLVRPGRGISQSEGHYLNTEQQKIENKLT